MDPVSHLSFGRILIQPAASRLGRGAVWSCMLGSIAPDVDLLVAFSRWDVYLRWHQAGTHALVGAAVCGIATGLAIRVIGIGKAGRLSLAAMLGCMGHLVLDFVSGADLRLLWPVSAGAVRLPLFAMADPWLLLLLVAGAVATARRPTTNVWTIVMVSVLGFLLAKGIQYRAALSIDAATRRPAMSTRAEARWGTWTRWLVFHADAEVVEAVEVDVSRASVRRLVREFRRLEDPLVIQSTALPTVRNFLASHTETFARIRRASDEASVLWSDLRYCRLDKRGGQSNDGQPLECLVWFGGEFGPDGRAQAAIGRIGPIVQRRLLRSTHTP
jgi:membrane-bound metal-dependent hydrolase YbcI (DUF457 family)